jgi:hypothetical protein
MKMKKQIALVLILTISLFANEKSFFPKNNLEQFIVDNLNLKSFGNSAYSQRPLEYDNTRDDLFFSDLRNSLKTTITKNNIEIEDKHWFYNIKILKKGDFNNDNIEDIWIHFTDDSKSGTYLTSFDYLITVFKKDGIIDVILEGNGKVY